MFLSPFEFIHSVIFYRWEFFRKLHQPIVSKLRNQFRVVIRRHRKLCYAGCDMNGIRIVASCIDTKLIEIRAEPWDFVSSSFSNALAA